MHKIALLAAALLIAGCAPQPQQPSNVACYTSQQLNTSSYDYLAKVADSLREDTKNMDDFSLFINGMKGSIEGYSGVIKSSTYLTNAIRFLPIPYAGEVSTGTKIVAGTLVNLNSAASALDRYRKSSSAFLSDFAKLDRNSAKAADLARLSSYADTKVLADQRALKTSLQDISTSASAVAAAAQALSNAVDTTGEYVNSAKSYIGLSSNASKEKTQIDESKNSIKSRLQQMSRKISSLENSAENNRQNIAKARIYADLALELETR
ncbi:MAG: hypothetical protein AB7S65_04135 [Sulfuricurvum sp.]